MVKPVLTKAFLQPAKAATMCTAPRAETRPPPPIPPILIVQIYLQIGLCKLITCGQSQMMPYCKIGSITTHRLQQPHIYKAVMRFMTSQNAPKSTQLEKRLRAQIHFSHTSYSLQIPALTQTLPLNPKFFHFRLHLAQTCL